MQHSNGYFESNEDDHSALLAAFPMPLPLDEPASNMKYESDEMRTPDQMASFQGGHQFNSAYSNQFSYHDPLHASNVNGSHLQDFDKQGRSDQMKLTFIMDGAGSASKTSAATTLSNPALESNVSTAPTHVQEFVSDFPSLSDAQSIPAPSLAAPAALVPSDSNKRMQACSACGVVFAMKSKALYHLYVHHPESAPPKVYPCSRCENAFLRKSDMVCSCEIARGGEAQLSIGGAVYSQFPLFRLRCVFRGHPEWQTKHFDCVHLRLRPSKCTACPSAFFFRKDLAKHIRTVHEKRRDHV
jgi:hypothetical protein